MALTIVQLEEKVLALIAFMTSHMSQIEAVKKDIQDLFKQISDMKAQQAQK